jgi:hypothetical protein
MRPIALVLLLISTSAMALWPADPRQRDAEMYAVWGAALDTLESQAADRGQVLLVDSLTAQTIDDRPALVALRAREPGVISAEAVEAFFSTSGPAVRVDPARLARHTRLRIAVSPRERARAAALLPGPGPAARIILSRVQFDHVTGHVLVEVTYECGTRCGDAAVAIMRKDAHGRWTLYRLVTDVIF